MKTSNKAKQYEAVLKELKIALELAKKIDDNMGDKYHLIHQIESIISEDHGEAGLENLITRI